MKPMSPEGENIGRMAVAMRPMPCIQVPTLSTYI